MKALLLALATIVVVTGGCNGILGIEEATLDRNANPPGDGTGTATTLSESQRSAMCTKYCSDVTKNCTGVNKQYPSEQACNDMCSGFGNDNAATGNTLPCRAAAAAAATGAAVAEQCGNAGPFGHAKCHGLELGQCESFCALVTRLCEPTASGYASFIDCFDIKCRPYAWRNNGQIFDGTGKFLDESANTLDCRMTHLEIAFSARDPEYRKTHCGHTGVTSATCNK